LLERNFRDVRLSGLERGDGRSRVRDHLVGVGVDGGDIGGIPVVRVLLEGDVVTERPLDELERAGTNDTGRVLAGRARIRRPVGRLDIAPDVLRHDAELAEGVREEEGGLELGDELDGVVVDLLERLENLIDGRLADGLAVLGKGLFEGHDDVVGVEVLAVVPLDAFLEEDGVGHAVLGDLPAISQTRRDLATINHRRADEAVVDEVGDPPGIGVGNEHRVHRRDVGGHHVDDLTALAGRLLDRERLVDLRLRFFAGDVVRDDLAGPGRARFRRLGGSVADQHAGGRGGNAEGRRAAHEAAAADVATAELLDEIIDLEPVHKHRPPSLYPLHRHPSTMDVWARNDGPGAYRKLSGRLTCIVVLFVTVLQPLFAVTIQAHLNPVTANRVSGNPPATRGTRQAILMLPGQTRIDELFALARTCAEIIGASKRNVQHGSKMKWPFDEVFRYRTS